MIAITIPCEDLCAHLRNDADTELCDAENICSASNRQLRIYHAMYMLDCGTTEAIELYDNSGMTDLIDRPGRLETPDIVQEILQLISLGASNGPQES